MEKAGFLLLLFCCIVSTASQSVPAPSTYGQLWGIFIWKNTLF
jgi:hypothetical protein